MAFSSFADGLSAVVGKLPAAVVAGIAAKLIACIGQGSPPCPPIEPPTGTSSVTPEAPPGTLDGTPDFGP